MGEWGNGGMGEWENGEMGEWGNGGMFISPSPLERGWGEAKEKLFEYILEVVYYTSHF